MALKRKAHTKLWKIFVNQLQNFVIIGKTFYVSPKYTL